MRLKQQIQIAKYKTCNDKYYIYIIIKENIQKEIIKKGKGKAVP